MRPDCFKNRHCNTFPFCPGCGQGFTDRAKVIIHLLRHSGVIMIIHPASLSAKAGGFTSSSTSPHFVSLRGLDLNAIHIGM